MPLGQLRGLGQYGVISDVNAYDLPPEAFSSANNVRFSSGSVSRAPVYRNVFDGLTPPTPAFAIGKTPASGFDEVIYAGDDGRIYRYANGSELNISAPGFSPLVDPRPHTGCFLADVLYINRPSHVPQYLGPAASEFAPLANWDSGWRCNSLRSYKDFLIALNVTKGASNYPTLVKWSDFAQANQIPGSWDHTSTTNLAGELTLTDLQGPIIDGLALDDVFIIYGETQTWLMEFTGTHSVFAQRRLFGDVGVINANCAVEVKKKHFVFGQNDLYVHDGSSWDSIADERIRDRVYSGLSLEDAAKFFVAHNPRLREIYFCYVSADGDAYFKGGSYCNRAAVYNYRNNTWSFMDLPNVSGVAMANVSQVLTYDQAVGMFYDTIGGTYHDLEDGQDKHVLMTSVEDTGIGLTSSKILGLDLPEIGAALGYPRDSESDSPAFVERVGIDLDDLPTIASELWPDRSPLQAYKVLSVLLPQVQTTKGKTVGFQIGTSLTPTSDVVWGPVLTFDPNTDYKVDNRSGGRYLAYRLYMDTPDDFKLSGFDAVLKITGRR
jgi:hypothetical protein